MVRSNLRVTNEDDQRSCRHRPQTEAIRIIIDSTIKLLPAVRIIELGRGSIIEFEYDWV